MPLNPTNLTLIINFTIRLFTHSNKPVFFFFFFFFLLETGNDHRFQISDHR